MSYYVWKLLRVIICGLPTSWRNNVPLVSYFALGYGFPWARRSISARQALSNPGLCDAHRPPGKHLSIAQRPLVFYAFQIQASPLRYLLRTWEWSVQWSCTGSAYTVASSCIGHETTQGRCDFYRFVGGSTNLFSAGKFTVQHHLQALHCVLCLHLRFSYVYRYDGEDHTFGLSAR